MSHITDLLKEFQDLYYNEGNTDQELSESELLRMRDCLAILQRHFRELAKLVEERTMRYIELNGEVMIGGNEKLYIGVTKVYNIKENQDIAAKVLERNGGDVTIFCGGSTGVLVSSPWKFGALKAVLGEETFNGLIETDYKRDVTTGKAIKTVKSTRADW